MKRPMFAFLCMTALLALSLAVPAIAGSLAGNEGEVRRRPYFTMGAGGCHNIWKRYVAAQGHSAYAITPQSRGVEGTICGAHFNAGSQQAAERKALVSCRGGLKRYKVSAVGDCEIAASK